MNKSFINRASEKIYPFFQLKHNLNLEILLPKNYLNWKSFVLPMNWQPEYNPNLIHFSNHEIYDKNNLK